MFGWTIENLDKLWVWMRNISTLDYGSLLKNFITAVLIIVVIFLSTHLEMIVSSPFFILSILGIIMLVIIILHLITDVLNKKAGNKEIKSVSKRLIYHDEVYDCLKTTLYSLNADRIFIEELHNTVSNFGDLGFVKLTMSYELINQHKDIPITYISHSYREQQASLYQIPLYLKRNGFFQGTQEEVSKIDNRYGFNMANEGDKYAAYIMIPGKKNRPIIGWIGIAWRDLNSVPKAETIKSELSTLTKDIAPLFQILI